MRDLDDMLRSVKYALIGLTLISIGVVAGLVLSTALPDGVPRSTIGLAAPESAPNRAAPGDRPYEVPQSLLPHGEDGMAPLTSPFTEVARKVVPAVVSVESRRMISHPPLTGPHQDLFRRFLPDPGQGGDPGEGRDGDDGGDDQIEVPSSGSGFIIDPAGYILTNDHVVTDSDGLTVHLADGRTFDAFLVGTDPGTDVAVVKVDVPGNGKPLPSLPLGDSDEVRVGDWAIAVGNPLGELEGTLTVGVVSAKGRKDLRIAGGGPVYQDFIQTDASINFGNSGGPLVNVRGEVIGINSAINPTGQGLGFAIPINMARKVGIELIRTGTVRRGYLGIGPEDVTDDIRKGWDMNNLKGILVGSVADDTPASKSGLKPGDVIVDFNDKPVTDVSDFRVLVAESGVGVDVPVHFLRDGKDHSIHVVLEERPDTPDPPVPHEEQLPGAEGPWLGATVQDVTGKLAKDYALSVSRGPLVTGVADGSPADRGGLREGDVILEVNRRRVEDTASLQQELEQVEKTGKPAVLLVQRGTTTTFVAIRSRG